MAGHGNGQGTISSAMAELTAGMAAHKAGRLKDAVGHYARAAELDPASAEAPYRLGVLALQAGDGAGAVRFLGQAVALDAKHVGARGNLARAFMGLGRPGEAVEHWRGVVAARADSAPGWAGLGDACLAAGYAAEAVEPYRHALALVPDGAAVRVNLGQALIQLGQAEDAEAAIRLAIEQAPRMKEAHYALGDALTALARPDEAQASYARALELDPQFVAARFNLGALAQEQGELDAARTHYDAVLAQDPDHARARNNRGAVLAELGQADAAIEEYRRAAALDPAYAEAHENLGNMYQELGRVPEAREAFGQALERGAGDGARVKRATLLPVVPHDAEEIAAARRQYETGLAELERAPPKIGDPLREIGKTGFYLAYAGENDRDLQLRLAQLYARACPSLLFRAPHVDAARPDGRIKIGFVSRFLRDHTIGRLMTGIILGLDRARFETVLLSPPQAPDAVSRALAAGVDRAIALPGGLAAARARIAEEKLDVLHFPDIGMEPFSYFLGFARLARLQCAFWGHPDTTGLAEMDYFLSSLDLDTGDAAAHYSENLVRLKTLNTCYARPEAPDPLPRRSDLGLPEDATLYVCAQTLFKFHPDFDAVLRAILEGDPRGRLVLIHGNHAHWSRLLKARLDAALGAAAERVIFLDRMDRTRFLALLARADVALDTTVFCGGNSTLETLAMGTPVVTLPTAYLRGRISAACYAKLDWSALVAKDEAHYARLALALGTDKDFRRAARAAIAERAPALFDDARPAGELADFLEGALRPRA